MPYVCNTNLLFILKNKKDKGKLNMIKAMIANELLSDEVRDEVIDGWNKSVDIPFISEKVERKIMIAIWTVLKSVLMKKI